MSRESVGPVDALTVQVREILAQALGVPAREVSLDASLADALGVDSLRMIQINVGLETRFGVVMPDPTTAEEVPVRTVRDLVAFVRSQLDGNGRGR